MCANCEASISEIESIGGMHNAVRYSATDLPPLPHPNGELEINSHKEGARSHARVGNYNYSWSDDFAQGSRRSSRIKPSVGCTRIMFARAICTHMFSSVSTYGTSVRVRCDCVCMG